MAGNTCAKSAITMWTEFGLDPEILLLEIVSLFSKCESLLLLVCAIILSSKLASYVTIKDEE